MLKKIFSILAVLLLMIVALTGCIEDGIAAETQEEFHDFDWTDDFVNDTLDEDYNDTLSGIDDQDIANTTDFEDPANLTLDALENTTLFANQSLIDSYDDVNYIQVEDSRTNENNASDEDNLHYKWANYEYNVTAQDIDIKRVRVFADNVTENYVITMTTYADAGFFLPVTRQTENFTFGVNYHMELFFFENESGLYLDFMDYAEEDSTTTIYAIVYASHNATGEIVTDPEDATDYALLNWSVDNYTAIIEIPWMYLDINHTEFLMNASDYENRSYLAEDLNLTVYSIMTARNNVFVDADINITASVANTFDNWDYESISTPTDHVVDRACDGRVGR